METVVQPEKKIDRSPKGIDLGKALTLRLKHHMSYPQIGKALGCSAQSIHERLQKFTTLLEDPESLTAHDNYTDQLLTGAMHKLLCVATEDERIKKSSTYQLAASYGILFDKQRLTRGQSTAIVERIDLTIDERDEIRRLEAMIIDGETQDVVLGDETPESSVVSD